MLGLLLPGANPLYGACQALTLIGAVLTAAPVTAWANDREATCGNSASVLNSNDRLESFDREHGGQNRRLQFVLRGREPCLQNECKLDVVYKASSPGAVDVVAGSLDLTHRDVRYCVYAPVSVKSQSVTNDAAGKKKSENCPDTYLVNYFEIELNDPRGAFSKQIVDILYRYSPSAVDVDLDRCADNPIVDYVARRTTWVVSFGDGPVAILGETDLPRQKIEGEYMREYFREPLALEVHGARRN